MYQSVLMYSINILKKIQSIYIFLIRVSIGIYQKYWSSVGG